MKYAVVIPVKNEEKTIRNTLYSLVNQEIQCVKCVVVDDMSTDNSSSIIKEFQEKYPFFLYLRNETSDDYKVGGHVVELFNLGEELLKKENVDYDYIVKLDADVSFEADFMFNIASKLNSNCNYGIVSGTPFYYQGTHKIFEYSPLWHTHGQFKIYDRQCLEEIGGIKKRLGWDCADNIIAMEKGWQTEAFRDVTYEMSRKVGGKTSLLKGKIKHGKGAYNLGYSPAYLMIKFAHDLMKPPYFLGGINYMYGYLYQFFRREKRVLDENEIKLLRRFFWKSFHERLKHRSFILFQLFFPKKTA